MTIWTPSLPQHDAPIYVRIADQLEADIGTGILRAGSRLPTQRDLADRLGVTVVTVTRAYREASERGLIESTVGRGSFVLPARREAATSTEIDLATNVVSGGPELTISRELTARLEETLAGGYRVGAGSERHRSAGAAWIAPVRPDASPSRIVVTAGAQHALLVSLLALTKPGDTLLVEELTYHGIKNLAATLHLHLEPLPLDRYGLLPDAFERAARNRSARALYTIPTMQNPTGSTMPEKRRKEIAAIAATHGIAIIEDDVYGFVHADPPRAITAHDPELGIFLSGTGKSLFPALRVGYLLAPPSLLQRVEAALYATTLFASPIGAEIVASAIEDGVAAKIVDAKRAACASRARLAARVLGVKGDPASHLWLTLPKRWSGDSFAEASRRKGVPVAAASTFAVRSSAPNAIRLSLGAPPSPGQLEVGLQIVASLLDGRPGNEGGSIV